MGVKWKIAKNQFPDMQQSLKLIGGKKVVVGALKGEHAWLAGIHEYGCKIRVTPKMRAWFAANGYPLKKSTTVITIPERSFLRGGHDEHAERVLKQCERALPLLLDGRMGERDFLTLVGEQMATAIKSYAVGVSPPDSEMTVDRKGSNTPLSDTGAMLESIVFEVES